MLKKNTKVLLIEDDIDDALLLRRVVFSNKFSSQISEWTHKLSLDDGINFLSLQSVDLVLVDLGLPECHGLESFNKIHTSYPHLPIIVLTGLDDQKISIEAVQKGAQDYLIKGKVDGENLIRSIVHSIERKKAEEKYRQLFEHSNDGIIIARDDGHIIDANQAAKRLFGYNLSEFLNLEICQLHPESHGKACQEKSKTIAQTKSLHFEIPCQTKDGRQFPGEISAKFLKIESLPSIQIIIRDISERTMLEKQKDEFISMASHELRTPIAILQGAIANLKDMVAAHENAMQSKMIAIAENNIRRLSRIITDLLDISRLESGQIEIKPAKLDLVLMFTEIVTNLKTLPQMANLTLNENISPQLPFALADEDQIIQVVNNLMSNALRYAKTKTVLTVELVQEGDKEFILVSIGNDGSFISDQDISKLFQKFSQVNRPVGGTGYKGTGLGLAICKEIVRQHGGKIWVESIEGELTTFKFTLPVYKEGATQ